MNVEDNLAFQGANPGRRQRFHLARRVVEGSGLGDLETLSRAIVRRQATAVAIGRALRPGPPRWWLADEPNGD